MAINLRIPCLLSLLLYGCAIGPDYTPPDTATPSSWRNPATAPQQSEPVTAPVDAAWWKSLNDPLLDSLIDRVAAANLDIQTATARMDQSRAERGISAAGLFPQIDGNAAYTREKLSDKGVVSLVGGGASSGAAGGGASGAASGGIPSMASSPPFDVYQYGLDLSWEIDLWGRVRRGVEAADASLQAAAEARRAAAVSTIAELANDYIQLRGTQARLMATAEQAHAAAHIADLADERSKAGLGNDVDTANARAEAATTAAQIPPLEQQRDTLMNAIALLLAEPPGALADELAPAQPVPPVPPQVPVGVPSDLLNRRPDIRQASAQLHAATADIGVAEADFFPKLTLMGDGMIQALNFKDLGDWAAHAYSFGPSVTLPIFEGGRLTATLELRKAQQRESALQYRKTVLTAFHETDNALTAFRAEQRRRDNLAIAVEQNRKALALALDLYKQGLGTFLDVLTDQQNLLAAEQQAITSRQTAGTDMVQLYKALGGGWEQTFPDTASP